MKTLSLLGFVGLMASVLAGCPIFSDNGQGGSQVCYGDGCSTCGSPADCPQNDTCGSDGQCHSGDCTTTACLTGYTCVVDPSSDTASCVPGKTGSGGAGTGGTGTGATSTGGTGGTGAGTGTGGKTTTTGTGGTTTTTGTGGTTTTTTTPVYCGHPSDCPTGEICSTNGTCQPGPCSSTNTCIYGYTCQANGTCASPTPNACDTDSTCASGDLCIAGSNGKGGVCTTATNQCFDQSQCGAKENCVAGKCTLGCASTTDCRDGFTCNTSTGVCSGVAKACTVTNDCGSASLVCVGGACVPRSPNGVCSDPGDVWDENGCIPNQAATFTCTIDGTQDACATGSICLHHDCWISCDSPHQSACASQPTLDACKPVADASSTYNVCGTSTNLGSQCGAGSPGNAACTGAAVCIDGFCK